MKPVLGNESSKGAQESAASSKAFFSCEGRRLPVRTQRHRLDRDVRGLGINDSGRLKGGALKMLFALRSQKKGGGE